MEFAYRLVRRGIGFRIKLPTMLVGEDAGDTGQALEMLSRSDNRGSHIPRGLVSELASLDVLIEGVGSFPGFARRGVDQMVARIGPMTDDLRDIEYGVDLFA